jgi:GNAT superfamily N-acetyltransferase
MVAVAPPPDVVVRRLVPGDVDALGVLMADAYRGGVDDHGETDEWHADEARKALSGAYGAVLWHASFVATWDGEVAGATVVTDWNDDHPGETGLSFALVAAASRGRGIGGALIAASGAQLAAAGHADWVLAVTAGNPARRLYERLGFVAFDPGATA